ncbi:hypothetical protein CPB85DRAFT_1216199, partial [Mucidula mucida]
WLLEELRTRDSHKWSGTNTHPVYHTNKLGNVINAFAHFVYMQSMSEIVLADIQTSTFRKKDILFDMMLHTTNGDGGIGDHGPSGI